jgi:hypothetical protein
VNNNKQKGTQLSHASNVAVKAPNELPWESEPPIANVFGFKSAVGPITVSLGYAMYPGAVLLYSHLTTPPSPPQLWRYHWTSKEEALRMAESLCAESDEYLSRFNWPRREVEDLDFEDFLEHLSARLNNELH